MVGTALLMQSYGDLLTMECYAMTFTIMNNMRTYHIFFPDRLENTTIEAQNIYEATSKVKKLRKGAFAISNDKFTKYN